MRVLGILALGAVLGLGRITGGAKLSFTVAGITVQPSEFIKIIFVFFVACMLYEVKSFKQVMITTVIAAIHVVILVVSTDLGEALIFFCYLCGNAVCGDEKCRLSGRRTWTWSRGCHWRIENIFPCTGTSGSMERSICSYR